MPITETELRRQNALTLELARKARLSKEDLVTLPRIQEFDLRGFDRVLVVKDKIAFPEQTGEPLTFDFRKLITGLIAGDFLGNGTQDIIAYYPHYREGQLLAVTTFTMSLAEAQTLLVICAKELGITSMRALQSGVRCFTTELSLFREEDWKLHEKDIADSLVIDLKAE